MGMLECDATGTDPTSRDHMLWLWIGIEPRDGRPDCKSSDDTERARCNQQNCCVEKKTCWKSTGWRANPAVQFDIASCSSISLQAGLRHSEDTNGAQDAVCLTQYDGPGAIFGWCEPDLCCTRDLCSNKPDDDTADADMVMTEPDHPDSPIDCTLFKCNQDLCAYGAAGTGTTKATSATKCDAFCSSVKDARSGRRIFADLEGSSIECKDYADKPKRGWCSVEDCGCKCSTENGYSLGSTHDNFPAGPAFLLSDCRRGTPIRDDEPSTFCSLPAPLMVDVAKEVQLKLWRGSVQTPGTSWDEVELAAQSPTENGNWVAQGLNDEWAAEERRRTAMAPLTDETSAGFEVKRGYTLASDAVYDLQRATVVETKEAYRCPWFQIDLGSTKLVTSVHLFTSDWVGRLGPLFFNTGTGDPWDAQAYPKLEDASADASNGPVDAGFRVLLVAAKASSRHHSEWNLDDACPDPELSADVTVCEDQIIKYAGGAGRNRFTPVRDDKIPGIKVPESLDGMDYNLVGARINCNGQLGRYVVIELPGAQTSQRRKFGLHEVQVYAKFVGEAQTFAKLTPGAASASSYHTNTESANAGEIATHRQVAQRLVDRYYTSLAQTQREFDVDSNGAPVPALLYGNNKHSVAQRCPWMQIDLGSSQTVRNVQLFSSSWQQRLVFLFFKTAKDGDGTFSGAIANGRVDSGFRVMVTSNSRHTRTSAAPSALAGDACPPIPNDEYPDDHLCETVTYNGGEGFRRFTEVQNEDGSPMIVKDGPVGAPSTDYRVLKAVINCNNAVGQYVVIDLPGVNDDDVDGTPDLETRRRLGLLEVKVGVQAEL
ncbi:unnamed protein product, partial [Amoebophrya sp. A120]|eukprot:GSA120T00013399001.1